MGMPMSDPLESGSMTQVGHRAGVPWLSVDDRGDDGPVWVRVVGGIFGDQAEEVWSTLEFALQEALGRVVVVNLAEVTAFDVFAVEALITIARTVKRWHVNMCAVVKPSSAISDYLASYSLGRLIPVYDSAEAASVAIDAGRDQHRRPRYGRYRQAG
jgi:anti-anti-sigma factor